MVPYLRSRTCGLLAPRPDRRTALIDATYDCQVWLFGDAGHLLRRTRVAIIGLGSVG
jgi:hypothetical protein